MFLQKVKHKITVFCRLLPLLLLASSPLQAETATIAVAANFTAAAKDLNKLFGEQTGHRLNLSFGSSGKLYTQISHGAPFAAFLSADDVRPGKLTAEGFAVAGTEFTYAAGKLVLFSQQSNLPLQDGEIFFSPEKITKYAIANPKTAPYGVAAKEVLANLQVPLTTLAKQVQGDSIAQTYQFVITGNASVGFVALSQVIDQPSSHYWAIPQNLYSPLKQNAVLLAKGENNTAAKSFLMFLKSDAAKKIMQGYGYETH